MAIGRTTRFSFDSRRGAFFASGIDMGSKGAALHYVGLTQIVLKWPGHHVYSGQGKDFRYAGACFWVVDAPETGREYDYETEEPRLIGFTGTPVLDFPLRSDLG